MNDTTSTTASSSNPIFDVFKSNSIVSSTSESISNFYTASLNNNTLYIGLFIVIVVTIVIAYLLYTYIGTLLFAKIKSVVSDTKVPVMGTKISKFTAELAKNANGSRKSFSFWIYINDMAKYKGQYQTVAAVSSDGTTNYNIEACSPYIFLDKNNNTLYCRFTKLDDKEYNSFFKQINTPYELHKFMQTGISIDYVPMQRWVHITIVCNSNTFKTTLYAYVDGELVKTISSNDEFKLSGYIDKYGIGPGFYGLLSSFTSYNYELNQQDIYNIYNEGPVTGFLAKLGLSSYGVRSPVYKL